ncbi:hypothetical protein GCM10010193_12060 [Kitasatospora atroaurantiaca]|uniref:Secreted protein n=1 Tax=Kitasatospora atroaurantiaca TaxID=285545 RepID=A0A561EQK7_9ACTN|nr:hypothetical protein [Kitasatospora atroaurantiaca]TWE17898.1 hypothetical protein FB465_2940 [Kitasatospora atroaurantiaca]
MRATWTAAVLTAALGLTTVTAVSANVAGAADTAAATAPRPAAVAQPTAGLPSVPDPTKTLDVLGALGGVLKLVNSLVASATPPSGTPDPAALQKLLDDLTAAVKDLVGKLPLPPLPPLPVSDTPRTAPSTLPVPVNPSDALAKVQKDATDLVAAATAAKPDPSAVQKVVPPLSVDSVAATVATTTSLTDVPPVGTAVGPRP